MLPPPGASRAGLLGSRHRWRQSVACVPASARLFYGCRLPSSSGSRSAPYRQHCDGEAKLCRSLEKRV